MQPLLGADPTPWNGKTETVATEGQVWQGRMLANGETWRKHRPRRRSAQRQPICAGLAPQSDTIKRPTCRRVAT
eukprot:7718318-Alexandrium_andersonii.AAC.1